MLRVGSWDATFLYQHLSNWESLADAVQALLPQPADQIPSLRQCLAQVGSIEYMVWERVNTAKNMRVQPLHLTTASRLRLETKLYEAEVAAKKVAPRPGAANSLVPT